MQETTHLKQLTNGELDQTITLLRELCDQIDPYATIDDETGKKLQSVSIMKWDDPFVLTNQLLLLMENAIEEQESRKAKTLQ